MKKPVTKAAPKKLAKPITKAKAAIKKAKPVAAVKKAVKVAAKKPAKAPVKKVSKSSKAPAKKAVSKVVKPIAKNAKVNAKSVKPAPKLIGIYDMLGRQVDYMRSNEIYIMRFDNGQSRKIMRVER